MGTSKHLDYILYDQTHTEGHLIGSFGAGWYNLTDYAYIKPQKKMSFRNHLQK